VDRWSVELSIREHEGQTRADARLVMDNDVRLLGHGTARRHPGDPNVAELGEKFAVARALSDVAHLLLGSAAAELEDMTHERARLARPGSRRSPLADGLKQ
jgi:Rv2632c-like